MTVSWTEVHCH